MGAVEFFAFDLTRADHVFGQRVQLGLTAQLEAEILHPAKQTALLARNLPEQGGKAPVIPG